ncbi:hypothetical protein CI109_101906 [Kwoniella shandongensis]|uniref:Uncharacterized protein n=1 Tax=Kwoniella shandongensis TaxID=1734106 RepID=A0A5M6BQ92_9TREE|nr:uncharacterized protein CI109_006778 [Kwoniella shandongensis]KAA5524907.1 hypothetical protein CI109_006778 [Kwoniella shandongensis]
MAELTPPSSNNNTPIRSLQPEDDNDPPSPTRHSTTHPLANSTMDLDLQGDQSSDSEMSADGIVVDGAGMEDDGVLTEGEGEGEGSDEGIGMDVESDEEKEEGGKGKEKQGQGSGSGSGLPARLDPRSSKTRKIVRGKRDSKRRSNITPSSSLGPLPSASSGGRKEGDLYESEIVARWNSDFGDVCADSRAAKVPASKTASAPAAPAPTQSAPVAA